MGNSRTKWMTLYRQECKDHANDMDKIRLEYEKMLLDDSIKNKWLSDKLIETQHKVRVLTHEIARKEEQIDDLQKRLRRKAGVGRSFKKKTLVETSVPSSAGGRSGDNSELHLSE